MFCQPKCAYNEGPNTSTGILATMKACSILVETEYTDGDYLDDFAAYYVKCFAHYDAGANVCISSKPVSKHKEELLKKVRGPLSKEEKGEELRKKLLGVRRRPTATAGNRRKDRFANLRPT